jgi:hypothetical protein
VDAKSPGQPYDEQIELINQLNDMSLTNLTSLKTMMTADGAQQLEHAITPMGKRFLAFETT